MFAEVSRLLSAASEGRWASEVAASVGVSRVIARRYLEHLAETGLALRRSRYAGQGRPEGEYRWSSSPGPGQSFIALMMATAV